MHSFVYVPVGVIAAMLPLYGVDRGIKAAGVQLPASVVCLVVLFTFLLALERAVGSRRVSEILHVLDVPMQFSLRWMNMYFVTPFLMLPLSPSVSKAETGAIAGVFIVGYLVTFAAVAYTVLLLQRAVGRSRRAHEEPPLPAGEQVVSTSTVELIPRSRPGTAVDPDAIGAASESDFSEAASSTAPLIQPAPPTAAVDLHTHPTTTIPDRCLTGDTPAGRHASDAHLQARAGTQPSSAQSESVAAWVSAHRPTILYGAVAAAGLPVYYLANVSLLLHGAIVVLCFQAALLVRPPYRLVVHPILLSCGLVLFAFYVLARLRGDTLAIALGDFKTGRTYLTLFDADYAGIVPGAGDMLASLLDVAIVSLALPMYQYRHDLRRHWFVLAAVCVAHAVLSFLAYPPVCVAIGIAPSRALAMVARSVTLALATPIVVALGGSTSLASVSTILSGIVGVLAGSFLLGPKCLRVRADDYVTRGITIGISSGAIGSVHLLQVDPRASALASLSLFLFGLVQIVLSAIPPSVDLVRGWVGL